MSPLAGEILDPSIPADRKEAFNIGLRPHPRRSGGRRRRAVPRRQPMARPGRLAGDDDRLFREDACARDPAAPGDRGRSRNAGGAFPRRWSTDRWRSCACCTYPAEPPAADGAIGAGAHTDYGNLTLLATDGVGGLEVRTRAGEWIAAPHVPGAFVCNIGDLLMRWSNDRYASTPHRVVNREGRERLFGRLLLRPESGCADRLPADLRRAGPAGPLSADHRGAVPGGTAGRDVRVSKEGVARGDARRGPYSTTEVTRA